ncbi:hypothetical protein [Urbifossiella limnaea]|uniref:Uncharacterized protein n=1 Tax=Urbifossiella limnaea TaxID=2528023 RepID=A0A517XNK1_9BACT|nr:hypothetical protein [Urbifossiella limnaea]QDU19078.1 hypothetical protein ETAA1_09810 [Urbifossiella limnaea]
MTRARVTVWAVVVLLAGCGRPRLPRNAVAPRDRVELEARPRPASCPAPTAGRGGWNS